MSVRKQLDGTRFELAFGSPEYPAMLACIPDPPQRVYGIGDPQALQAGVAIIGARKATPYGLHAAQRFARHAAAQGLTIIAGGAIGCDLAAHSVAVEMRTPTVVVFGSGADVVYPQRGFDVFQQAIEQGGAVISENPWGTEPFRGSFVRRNRIIAGLSMLLLIAEAGLPSGTFSTADAALAQGKEVAVVPGAITSPNSAGANRLLCQGATPVVDEESFDDALVSAFALSAFSLLPARMTPASPPSALVDAFEHDEVLRALSAEPYRADELSSCFGIPAADLAARLSRYELQGLVERARDGRYHVRVPVRE